jgi:hypothetical protein
VLRAWEVVDSFLTYSTAEVAEDGLGAGPWPLRLEIRQRGTMGISRPLMIDLP